MVNSLAALALAQTQITPTSPPVAFPYKSFSSAWSAIASDNPINTGGWTMTGLFTVTTEFKGGNTIFRVGTNVYPGSTDVQSAGNVYQAWVQFAGWDTSSTPSGYNNAVCGFTISGTASLWSTNAFQLQNSCGTELLGSIKLGGYTAVTGSNITCINPWYTNTDKSFGLDGGKIKSSCGFNRPMVFIGANTIKVGDKLTFLAGFTKWKDSTVGKTIVPTAFGQSQTLTMVVVDGANALVFCTILTSIFTLWV